MLVLRYFLLVQAYHWASFFQVNPLSFVYGVLLFPIHLFKWLAYEPNIQAEAVSNGVKALKTYWEIPGALTPPKCVRRRLIALEAEVDNR